MKKLLTFLLCFVLLMGAVGLTACGSFIDSTQKTVSNADTDKPVAQLSVQSVSAPKLGGTKLTTYSTRSGQTGISKRLSATVEPASAQNKLVDYRVFWLGEGDHTSDPVTEYVVVEQDSDGSTDATVTCIQPFGDDTVIIQVVTRDGGYTAQCVATYAGFISEMSITSPTLNTVNTAARGDYYEVFTNQTYTFNVNLDNALHSVGTYDLSVATGGVGEFWFYNTLQYEEHFVQFQNRNGWYEQGFATKYSLGDIANKFITASINDNVVTVTVNSKELQNYFEEVEGVPTATARQFAYCNEVVYKNVMNSISTYGSEQVSENAANLPSAYFTVTVTDSVTNISETIKLWVESGVDGVSLSNQTLEF